MKLVISGYYGFNNTGDEAILESLITGFEKIDPKIKLVFLSNNPEQTKKTLNANAIPRNRIFWPLLTSKGFISGGGGLLQDKTSSKSLWYYLSLIFLAKFLGKKTFIFAQGIGPIKSGFNKFLLRLALNGCSLITVRDKASFNYLNSLNLCKTRLVCTADPTFILYPKEKEEKEFDPHKRPLIGISVRNCAAWNQLQPRIAKTADIILEKYNAQVIFIPFQWPEDIIACNQVIRLMKNKVKMMGQAYDPRQMLWLISRLDLMIGMRLHSLMFAVSNLVPALGISYDPKVDNFMKEACLPVISMNDFSVKDAVSKIDELQKNRTGVVKSLSLIKKEIYDKSIDNFILVGSLLR
ncbi:MAG: polysaccharide pyruvyl transferase CsaB [Candidatus Saganbacteria bacterium]|nr:polysaccharide pyruvyl transferase CsaB [Candidatus Saganbacteria bacterium]